MNTMRAIMTLSLLAGLVAACNQGTSGGPGATTPPSKTPIVGQPPGTFSLAAPALSTRVSLGKPTNISIGIKRAKDMDQEVTLKFADLPKGVTVDPASPAAKRGDLDVKVALTATTDAAPGDYTIKVVGHPDSGADASTDLKITVVAESASSATEPTVDALKGKRDEYVAQIRKTLDTLGPKYEDLKSRAAVAQGDLKKDLDAKVEIAKQKRDEALNKLDELNQAGADRWDKVKDAVQRALDDLQKAFD